MCASCVASGRFQLRWPLGGLDCEHPCDEVGEGGRVEAIRRELRAADDCEMRALDDVLLVALERALKRRVCGPVARGARFTANARGVSY